MLVLILGNVTVWLLKLCRCVDILKYKLNEKSAFLDYLENKLFYKRLVSIQFIKCSLYPCPSKIDQNCLARNEWEGGGLISFTHLCNTNICGEFTVWVIWHTKVNNTEKGPILYILTGKGVWRACLCYWEGKQNIGVQMPVGWGGEP